MLEAILSEIRPLANTAEKWRIIYSGAGTVFVSGDKLGIAISTVDGQHFAAGDAHERFPSSQSQGIEHGGVHEPLSGGDLAAGGKILRPARCSLQLEIEQGKPRNPFINAGAGGLRHAAEPAQRPRQRMLRLSAV